MKSIEQKRKEAIERLEREPRWNGYVPEPVDWREHVKQRRLSGAAWLRERFGLVVGKTRE